MIAERKGDTMYFLSVEGALLCAGYEKERGQNEFRRVYLHQDSEPNPKEGGEILEAKMKSSENKDNLREVWVVLYGTPRRIRVRFRQARTMRSQTMAA